MLVVFVILLAISVGSAIFPIVALVSAGTIRTPQPDPALQLIVALLMCAFAILSGKWFWFVVLAFLLATLAEDYLYYRRRFKLDATAPLPARRMGWQVLIFSSWIACLMILYL